MQFEGPSSRGSVVIVLAQVRLESCSLGWVTGKPPLKCQIPQTGFRDATPVLRITCYLLK